MRHVEEPSVTAGNGGAVGAEHDDLAVITHLGDPAVRQRAADSSSPVDAGPVESSPVGREDGELRDYAQLTPVVQATPGWLHPYTVAVVVSDAVAALISAVVAITAFNSPVNPWVVTLFPPAWVAALAMGRTYEHRFVGNGSEEYKRLFHTSVVFLAVVGTLAYAGDVELTRGVVVVGLPTAMVLSLVAHWAARQILHTLRRHGRCMQQVVAVGLERSVAELIRSVRREPHAGLHIAAACIDRPRGETVEGVPVRGDSDHVLEVLRDVGADTVAVTAWSDVSQNDLRRLSWDLEGSGVTLLVAPRLTDISGPRIHIRPVAGLPLLNIEEPEFTGVRRIVKGGLDRLLALLAVVLLSPLLVGISLAIAVTSRGPILFRQIRIGRHGEPFVIHKFRSMYVNAEQRLADVEHLNEADGELFKMRDDPRVTPIGYYLRRFSLDELPQFFDVLLGRMSLVGPRPPLPTEVDRYASLVRRRLVVKPGITGLWQVSGRSDLSWDESVRLDLLYVETWSLALDIAIMLKTVLAVLRRRGAY
jgi:exopolysaccharide biosynthesis polyprenyl glycosylphosphotransferase